MKAMKFFNVVPELPDKLKKLEDLSYNLWIFWNHEAVTLFHRIDPKIWEEVNHNPVMLLGRVSQERLMELNEDEGFINQLDRIYKDFEQYISAKKTYSYKLESPGRYKIAYLSMEYGLTEALPIYSGGLGVLSGDHLKSSSDLSIPLVGVGLLYQQGYFQQYLNTDGWQQEEYAENDLHNMPIKLLYDEEKKPITVKVKILNEDVYIRIWKVQVGRVPLYLLDTNNIQNSLENRKITSQLYGGDREMRIKQEIVLGIGGLRALEKLGISFEVVHMNEGHSAFSIFENIRMHMQKGLSFHEARELVKVSHVFTTHTAVPAGNDWFSVDLIKKYFTDYAQNELHIPVEELINMGRDENLDNKDFCMTILGLKYSHFSNGVSELHSKVTKKIWKNLWKNLPEIDIPIGAITNGIHIPTWVSGEMSNLFNRYLGYKWREEPDSEKIWQNITEIPDTELWRTHEIRRERLVNFIRRRLRMQLEKKGASIYDIEMTKEILNPDALTIGFARRFATYKRGNLLLKDVDRLAKILTDSSRPVQIIFAGKAHPMDHEGKELIKNIMHLIRYEPFRRKIVFVENYDINVARYLVQGVDVWLNTPRRPLEACGTSGMKVLANGGINFSVLDGWWDEGYNKENGWAIGNGEEYENLDYQDMVESKALYDILEKEIIPTFYDRTAEDIPRKWIEKMKKSMVSLCPQFNSNRMLEDYMVMYYDKSARKYLELVYENFALLKETVKWQNKISENWDKIKIVNITSDELIDRKVNSKIKVTAELDLGNNISPDDINVEIYVGRVDSYGYYINRDLFPMEFIEEKNGLKIFTGHIDCKSTGKFGFMLRVIPNKDRTLVPLGLNKIVFA